LFDDELVGRVKAFQAAEGMEPDGVAGALTLMRLNLRLDPNLPRLSKTVLGGLNVLHP
jgi:murein L,D-transpeptidase YcbB/YkuD